MDHEVARVSVVVPTFMRRDIVRQCVDAALTDADAFEVIVVVDGSDDGTLEALDRVAARQPRLHAVWMEHAGEMRARAKGADMARGDVVLFLDDDVVAAPGIVRAHARRHASVSRAVVVGYMPVVTPDDHDPRWPTIRLYASEYERRVAEYERDSSDVLMHLWGGNFSMRRSDCLAVGMADTAYRARYYPDRDFGLRCLEHGLVGLFARDARATHLYRRSLASFVDDARGRGEGRVLLHCLHAGILGPPEGSLDGGVPWPARVLIRAGSSVRALDRFWTGVLTVSVRILGRVGLRRAQVATLRVLRRVAQGQGTRDALARAAIS